MIIKNGILDEYSLWVMSYHFISNQSLDERDGVEQGCTAKCWPIIYTLNTYNYNKVGTCSTFGLL